VAVGIEATPAQLSLVAGDGRIDAAFEDSGTIRLRGRGLGLALHEAAAALTPFTGTYMFTDPLDGGVVLTSYETGRRYRITVLEGVPSVVGDGALGVAERLVRFSHANPWELAIEEFETAAAPFVATRGFDRLVDDVRAEFAAYRDSLAPTDPGPISTRAAYVMWSATVRPAGFVGREAILMSKHWMDKVWSWDHCFNALALAEADPNAALDQFLLPFDHADPTGAMPDSITHSEVLYNFVKPPIHGWAFAALRDRAGDDAFTTEQLTLVYQRLANWTRFWLDYRRAPGHALPHYQHGNDSGWDNSTTFDNDRVIESPDLAAFLIIQLDVLAELALELGIADAGWSVASAQLEKNLLTELWDGNSFVARSVATGQASTTTSLLNTLPIVLGDRLPTHVRNELAARIREHLTAWGPATELVDSSQYESDGYWRGPIWAPSTFLIENGLRRAGFSGLADAVSDRFRALCRRSGFAENFDAVTGEGLRDRAYTWTASAYLVLAEDAARRAAVAA
jgi:glycogen debranching enzyme